jgi:Cu/Ag efflux protein CusF
MNSSSSQNFVTPTSNPQGNHNNQHNQHQQSAGGGGGGSGGSGSGSSFVQRNSVQNQFAALSADRDKFVREVEEANKELKKIQVEHQSIKIEHDTLIEHNRQAMATLGDRKKTLEMWEDKKTLIIRKTDHECLAIHSCTNHSKTVSCLECSVLLFLYFFFFFYCCCCCCCCCVTDINNLDHDRWSLAS